MAFDLSKLSDADLQALANGDMSSVSDAGLRYLSKNAQDIPTDAFNKTDNTASDLAGPAAAAAGIAATPALAKGIQGAGQIAQTAGQIAGPALGAAKETLGTYIKSPAAGIADAAMAHIGLPPPVAGSKMGPGMLQSAQNLTDWIKGQGQFAPDTSTPAAPTTPPAPAPDELAAAQKASQAMTPEQLVSHMQGGAPAPQAPGPVAPAGAAPAPATTPQVGGPAAQEGSTFLERMAQEYGTVASKIGGAAGTALRVLGSAPVAGAQMMTYSPSLNQGEDEWARQQREKYLQVKQGLNR
ncbi:MAG TPA: hypothetical protein VFM18_11745 [Methanosarcina sp.]|nr:hypothetical protein [Methanosarcina sp.]